MKVIKLTDKATLARHWFRWYYVDRSGARWQPVKPIIELGSIPKMATIASAAASFKRPSGLDVDLSDLSLDK